MAKAIRPKIVAASRRLGGKAIANSGDNYGERLSKYIPLKIAAAYPVLDNALAAYVKEPIPDLSPVTIGIMLFVVLCILIIIEVKLAYKRSTLPPWGRRWCQAVQTVFNILAFTLWTYTLRGQVWGGTNNPGLAAILDSLFLLVATYIPTISLDNGAPAPKED